MLPPACQPFRLFVFAQAGLIFKVSSSILPLNTANEGFVVGLLSGGARFELACLTLRP